MATSRREAGRQVQGGAHPRVRTNRVRRAVLDLLPAIALLALLVAGWELWVRVNNTPSYVMPAPSAIWEAFLEIRGTMPGHIRTTVMEAVLGLLASVVLGVTLAVGIAAVPMVRRAVFPILVISQTIPMIVLAPLFILWFGFGLMPKVYVVALVCFFPIVVSTVDGLTTGVDREMLSLVRSMGASKAQVMRVVRIPAALPSFFAGMKIASAYAVIGAVVGEWISASSGLGVVITRSQQSYRLDRIFVAVVFIAMLSIALFTIVQVMARLATPWMFAHNQEEKE